MHVDPQQSLGPGAGKGALGIFDVVENGDAALMVGRAIQCRTDMARRALQQANAKPCLQLLDRIGHRRTRQAEILRGLRETAPFDDA
ncbi:hypothetical protein D3C86_1598630 [compost metagenome]